MVSVSPPALTITLGRKAYRWPLRVCLAALTAGLAVSLSVVSGPRAWDPERARTAIALCGGGAVLVALAAAAWGLLIHRNRLIATIGGDGVTLRRAGREARVPADAVDAVGITWPVADPVLTLWYDPGAAPDAAAVARTEGRAAALFRESSLPEGWAGPVRAAVTGTLGAPWRVVNAEGREVGRPPRDALLRADHILVDDDGVHRDEHSGALLALACGRSLPGGRTVVLRDPHARTLLVFRKGRPWSARVRVYRPDGSPVGELRGAQEPSFHTPDGTLLGTTRRTGDRHVVTGVDARESASLQHKDGGGRRLVRSPSAPEPLRALALALPLAARRADRR